MLILKLLLANPDREIREVAMALLSGQDCWYVLHDLLIDKGVIHG